MTPDPAPSYSVFAGHRRVATGPLQAAAVAAAEAQSAGDEPVLVFSDATGEQLELDLRGKPAAVVARYALEPAPTEAPRGRGRPRLGVVAREVTLLPEQWEWLAAQPGGASVVLRRLVQEARRSGGARERLRRAQERSYRVLVALAGNLPRFEEAARALFANQPEAMRAQMKGWPADVQAHVLRLADPEFAAEADPARE